MHKYMIDYYILRFGIFLQTELFILLFLPIVLLPISFYVMISCNDSQNSRNPQKINEEITSMEVMKQRSVNKKFKGKDEKNYNFLGK